MRSRYSVRFFGLAPPVAWTLAGLVVAALAVRLWGIAHGLPHVYHTDEEFEVKRALKLGAGQFDLHRAFKGGLYYLLFLEYGVYFVAMRLAGEIRSSYDFLVHYFRDPTPMWMIGRVTVALIGAATLIPVFALGRRMGGAAAGLAAAIFLGLAFDHVWSSHFITVDVLMVALLALSFLHLQRAAEERRLKDLLLASLFAALATATKLPAIVAVLPIALIAIVSFRGLGPGHARVLLLTPLVFLATTAIVNPGFYPEVGRLIGEKLGWVTYAPGAPGDPLISRTENVSAFYALAMVRSLGWPLATLGGIAAVDALRRRRLFEIALLLFAGVTYVFICLPLEPDQIYPRYTLPIQLVIVLLAGRSLAAAELRARAATSRGSAVSQIAFAAAVLLLVLSPAIHAVRQDMMASRPDTRTLTKRWVEETIPDGSKIVIEGRGYEAAIGTVPLLNQPENVERIVARFRDMDGRWQAQAEEGGDEYSRTKDRFHRAAIDALAGRKTYDLMLAGSENFPYRPLEEYVAQGAQYVILDPDKLASFLQQPNAERFPEVAGFYRDLMASDRVQLLRRAEREGGLGPRIDVYAIRLQQHGR